MSRRYRREKGPRPFMPLRRNGQFFSTWNALSGQERCRVVADIDRQALDRLAGMSPTLVLGDGSSPEVIEVVIAVVVRLVCWSVTHGVLRPGWWVVLLVMVWRTLWGGLKVTVTSWRSGAAT